MKDSTNKIIEEAAALTGVVVEDKKKFLLLPRELVEAGWVCQRSASNDRFYYFNVNTNESRSDLPAINEIPPPTPP